MCASQRSTSHKNIRWYEKRDGFVWQASFGPEHQLAGIQREMQRVLPVGDTTYAPMIRRRPSHAPGGWFP